MPNNYKNMSYDEMINLLKKESVCVLSISDNNIPYAIFMNYSLKLKENDLYIEMKTKSKGIKMDCLRNNQKVCLLFKKNSFNTEESVLAFGIASISEPDYIICNSCNKTCRNCNLCEEKSYKQINIKLKEISGRKYNKY